MKHRIATLAGVLCTLVAGAASATIVQVSYSGDFYYGYSPDGLFAATDSLSPDVHYTAYVSFAFDTDLGAKTTGPGGEFLQWDISSGTPSPFLGGTIDFWFPVAGDVTLTRFDVAANEATRFFAGTSTDLGVGAGFSGLTFSSYGDGQHYRLGYPPQTPPPGGWRLDVLQYGGNSASDVQVGAVAPGFEGISGYLCCVVLAPAPAPVPEPSTWFLMIGGLGLVGSQLRRHRAFPACPNDPQANA